MRADADVTSLAGGDGGEHDEWITGVKATGHVGNIDEGEEFIVGTLEMSVSVAALGERGLRGEVRI